MPAGSHAILGGKVRLYRRPESALWQCSTYLGAKNHRKSTGKTDLAEAMLVAADWYIDRLADERLRERERAAAPKAPRRPRSAAAASESPPRPVAETPPARAPGKTFREVAAVFVREFEVMTAGERNREYVAGKSKIIARVLNPFFGDADIRDVSAGMITEYRMRRLEPPETAKDAPPEHVWRGGKYVRRARRRWTRPARNTLHIEIVCLRQVLKTAARHGWIEALPDMTQPYKKSGKVGHRAWFSPGEYKQLYAATRERARHPKKPRWRPECEKLHDWVLFMVNTGLRPDEAKRLEDRDISVVTDAATGERILEIEVRGKRGVGHCKSMPGAVTPYLRHRKRAGLGPNDLVWGEVQRQLFNAVLAELGLKKDRDGNARTAYSLRHTYICLRLLEGADIYQVAKNCRTSVEMIEKHYAIHLKDTLDAAAINVRKADRPKSGPARARA